MRFSDVLFGADMSGPGQVVMRGARRDRPRRATRLVVSVVAAIAVTVVAGGCGGSDRTEDPGGGADSRSPADAALSPSAPDDGVGSPSAPPDTAGGAAPTGVVRAAIEDLTRDLGVSPQAVTVLDVEDVTWNDGSLGCPEPGRSYTQALVDGYRIVLESDGRTFAYHGADDGPPRRCDRPASASPG